MLRAWTNESRTLEALKLTGKVQFKGVEGTCTVIRLEGVTASHPITFWSSIFIDPDPGIVGKMRVAGIVEVHSKAVWLGSISTCGDQRRTSR
jgi:hypothetical protein